MTTNKVIDFNTFMAKVAAGATADELEEMIRLFKERFDKMPTEEQARIIELFNREIKIAKAEEAGLQKLKDEIESGEKEPVTH